MKLSNLDFKLFSFNPYFKSGLHSYSRNCFSPNCIFHLLLLLNFIFLFQKNKSNRQSIIEEIFNRLVVKVSICGFRNIVLDLGDVQYVDSSGLSALLVGNRLCKEATGTFVLTGLNAHIQKLIKISQLEPILNIVPSLSESVDYVMMEELDRDLRT